MSTKNESVADNFIGWESALAEARRQRGEAEARVRCLKQSIKLIEKKIEGGEPWPGQSYDRSNELATQR
jgi:hypothetical protein